MTVTVVGIWEPGFSDEQMFIEWRMWKQTVSAYAVDRWCMVGSRHPNGGGYEAFPTMASALLALRPEDDRIFLIPGAKQKGHLSNNPAYIFGNANENLHRYVNDEAGDVTVGIQTPQPIDMFAACCLPLVLS